MARKSPKVELPFSSEASAALKAEYDLVTSYPRQLMDAFNSGHWKSLDNLISTLCIEDCALSTKMSTAEDIAVPPGLCCKKDREVHGGTEVAAFWKAISVAFPDAILSIDETKIRKIGKCQNVVCKFSFSGTKMSQIDSVRFPFLPDVVESKVPEQKSEIAGSKEGNTPNESNALNDSTTASDSVKDEGKALASGANVALASGADIALQMTEEVMLTPIWDVNEMGKGSTEAGSSPGISFSLAGQVGLPLVGEASSSSNILDLGSATAVLNAQMLLDLSAGPTTSIFSTPNIATDAPASALAPAPAPIPPTNAAFLPPPIRSSGPVQLLPPQPSQHMHALGTLTIPLSKHGKISRFDFLYTLKL